MSKFATEIRTASRPSPTDVAAATIGGLVGIVLWTLVMWKLDRPTEMVLGYLAGGTISLYIILLIAFFKEKARCEEQYCHAMWKVEAAQYDVEAAKARQAFAEKLRDIAENEVRTLEAQLDVVKKHREARRRQFKHYGGGAQ